MALKLANTRMELFDRVDLSYYQWMKRTMTRMMDEDDEEFENSHFRECEENEEERERRRRRILQWSYCHNEERKQERNLPPLKTVMGIDEELFEFDHCHCHQGEDWEDEL